MVTEEETKFPEIKGEVIFASVDAASVKKVGTRESNNDQRNTRRLVLSEVLESGKVNCIYLHLYVHCNAMIASNIQFADDASSQQAKNILYIRPIVIVIARPSLKANGELDRVGKGRYQFACTAPFSRIEGNAAELANAYEYVLYNERNQYRENLLRKDKDYLLDDVGLSAEIQICVSVYRSRVYMMQIYSLHISRAVDDLFDLRKDALDEKQLRHDVQAVIEEYSRYCYINTEFVLSKIDHDDIKNVDDAEVRNVLSELFANMHKLANTAFDLLWDLDQSPTHIIQVYINNELKESLKDIRRIILSIVVNYTHIAIIRLPYNHIWFTDAGSGVSCRERMVKIISLLFTLCHRLIIHDTYHSAGLYLLHLSVFVFAMNIAIILH